MQRLKTQILIQYNFNIIELIHYVNLNVQPS